MNRGNRVDNAPFPKKVKKDKHFQHIYQENLPTGLPNLKTAEEQRGHDLSTGSYLLYTFSSFI